MAGNGLEARPPVSMAGLASKAVWRGALPLAGCVLPGESLDFVEAPRTHL